MLDLFAASQFNSFLLKNAVDSEGRQLTKIAVCHNRLISLMYLVSLDLLLYIISILVLESFCN